MTYITQTAQELQKNSNRITQSHFNTYLINRNCK